MSVLDGSRPVTADRDDRRPRRTSPASVARWEVEKLLAQLRFRLLCVAALVGPVLVVLVVGHQSQPPKDTLFGRYATTSGGSLALLVLGFAGQWLLPLLASAVGGDVLAGEDQHGTWKTILTRSASRATIFWSKVVVAWGATIVLVVLLAGSTVAAALVLGGPDPLVGVSGQELTGAAVVKVLLESWATVLPPALAVASLAVLVSVATRSAVAGVVAPAVLALVMQLVGALGPVSNIRPLLLSTPFEAWHGLVASPRFVGPVVTGVVVSAVWCAVCVAASFVLVRRRDITGG